jgi:hypothetical protein
VIIVRAEARFADGKFKVRKTRANATTFKEKIWNCRRQFGALCVAGRHAGLATRDPADLEVCATAWPGSTRQ